MQNISIKKNRLHTTDPSLFPTWLWIPPPTGPSSSTSIVTWYELDFLSCFKKKRIFSNQNSSLLPGKVAQ